MIQKDNRYKKIGIMGGTFDPIHYGHLIASKWAKENFELDKVIFIPAGVPPHKKEREVLSAEHRYFMTLLATIDEPDFDVSTIEIDRQGPSYTIDTIKELQAYYKDIQIFFITGADAILEIHTWRNYEELIKSCYFIVATREGYDTKELYKRIEKLDQKFGKRIFHMKIPPVGISSTELRNRIQQGKTVKYLIPPMVEEYIKKKHLY
ncbi:nicotinate-nucleotide adenylyltransferase [Garciella nitratireducens]|uniref:Probable nicotinate-nucleotide adenylyltransferase n=1 Tax=Garciella nitratireducens DSM 15102 TaxID=1121911 RepID=A0A1T4KT98_9FIRM|nr:nicotinate-nucleotide adenylyltransferase [Garciella nitratireducens]RBP39559.1 nicotinate-nucleotide adenylyltransferase [Garciella nitratireducens]SJZ45537.1 nicotinate-nucleotide adenylyltransferase [Garciella nitratireducens DSM 15102]